MKRTKILATYGPAIDSIASLKQLIKAGVNAFRINCSHGDKSHFLKAVKNIREAAAESPYPVGLLFDISGPKLRLARFTGELKIETGHEIILTTEATDLDASKIAVNHPAIISSVKAGERLFIDDGNLIFDILSVSKTEIIARATFGGTVLPAKGINLPDTDIQIPTITDKDREDFKTAVEAGADFIALSFVRSGDDIIEARQLIKQYGGHQKVIAKLEKREAIEDLEQIMLLADGVMIARGDLGVEMDPAELPRLQKRIIRVANQHHRPVIVATQMMESMRFSPRATRAEISDVASAVFDNADAVMLSAETATGKYPLEAVQAMTATIEAAEPESRHPAAGIDDSLSSSPVPYSIAGAVSTSNLYCDTKIIFALTSSGYTAGLISNLFPPQLIIALSPDINVRRALTLCRSVYSVPITSPESFTEMIEAVNQTAREFSLAHRGDRVIITGGAPFGSQAETNFMMIHEID